ncbi:MAG: hypothetical protein ABEI98_10820, partial [Halorhabdus sp.]
MGRTHERVLHDEPGHRPLTLQDADETRGLPGTADPGVATDGGAASADTAPAPVQLTEITVGETVVGYYTHQSGSSNGPVPIETDLPETELSTDGLVITIPPAIRDAFTDQRPNADDPDATSPSFEGSLYALTNALLGVLPATVHCDRSDMRGLDDIRADQRPELLLLATEILEEMLQTPNAAPAVEDHWEEIVSSQWRTYDMADRTKYGGSATSTLEGKVEALKTFYDEKIDEFQEELENVDLGTIGQVQEFFPPWHPLTESDREAAEQKLDKLRESRDDLLEADGRYQRVQGMKEAVRSRRNRAKNLLDDKVSSVNSLITARESEKEEAKNRIEALDRSIEQEKDELASEGTGKRLGIFPLRRDMLDDEELTLQRVDDELNSLDDYVTQGFIDERKVRNGINQWLSNATSWEEPVFDMNYSETDRGEEKNPRQEMWLLYHEDNEQYAVEGVDTMIGGTTRRSGSDNMIDYINDPYSISFVSFHNRGPVEALTLYQRLRDMADRGQLDPMAGKYRDYRQAFAYPEWYDRNIRLAFQIKSRIEIPRPPELDIDRYPIARSKLVRQTGKAYL